jgi:3-hydroxyisobutyrate dehydrogenase-like beta-hydroxyacid dehydrogenase
LLRVVVALCAALALAACGQKEAPSSGATGGGGGGQETKVAFVPKLVGIPYFEAMKLGGELAAKDLGLAAGLAAEHGLELRLAQAARSRLQAADRDGLGEQDFSAVVAHLRGAAP